MRIARDNSMISSDKSLAPYELIIDSQAPIGETWLELWRYRGLLYFLTWRDILIRYKQTAIGVVWAVLPSLMTMLIFTIVFGKFARLNSSGVPYPILVLAATLPWNLFANALSQSGGSLLANQQLISKVYFPRLIIPLSAVLVSLVDFLCSSGLLALIMGIYHYPITWRILTLPFFLILALATAMGAGFWLAALNVKYRDFRYAIPFIVQLGLYISPVGFESDLVPQKWRLLYALNPMVGVIEGFRWALLGRNIHLYRRGVCLSMFLMMILLVSGLRYFRKVEQEFADVI